MVAERVHAPHREVGAERQPGHRDPVAHNARGQHPAELRPAESPVVRVLQEVDGVVPVHEPGAEDGGEDHGGHERDGEASGAARQAGRDIVTSLPETKNHRPGKSTGRQWVRDAEAPRRPSPGRHLPGDVRGLLARPPGRIQLGRRHQPGDEPQIPGIRHGPDRVDVHEHPDGPLHAVHVADFRARPRSRPDGPVGVSSRQPAAARRQRGARLLGGSPAADRRAGTRCGDRRGYQAGRRAGRAAFRAPSSAGRIRRVDLRSRHPALRGVLPPRGPGLPARGRRTGRSLAASGGASPRSWPSRRRSCPRGWP